MAYKVMLKRHNKTKQTVWRRGNSAAGNICQGRNDRPNGDDPVCNGKPLSKVGLFPGQHSIEHCTPVGVPKYFFMAEQLSC